MKRDRQIRTRYVRELERFVNRIVDFFSKNRTKNELHDFLDKAFEPLQNIEKTYLSNEYPKELEKFVKKNANLHLSDKSMDELKEDVMKEANLLRKLKRKKSFSKEKHKKRSYEE